MTAHVAIIGGGLAGSEAAWQLARQGIRVDLYEMRPHRTSPVHKSQNLAELVCSNSFKSDEPGSAPHLLKNEMRALSSLILKAADATAIPSGKALSVDRDDFAHFVTRAIEGEENIQLVRQEVASLEGLKDYAHVIVATGPLTSESLAASLLKVTGAESLYFYDSVAPIVYADSLNRDVIFEQSRYNKGEGYLNCPLNKEEYFSLVRDLREGEKIKPKDFEPLTVFEGCMPIEVLAERGEETLAFGPMRPVGLTDPRTGRRPYAVLQLRQENRYGSLYNMVGFQTRLKWPEQERIFRKISGLENARFARFGVMHRNTYLDAPRLLDPFLRLQSHPRLSFAGQMTGVEGYLESAATGLMVGRFIAMRLQGREPEIPGEDTACGALLGYLQDTTGDFKPMNINWGLFSPETRQRLKTALAEPIVAHETRH